MKAPSEISAMMQVLVKGRVSEALTMRPMTGFTPRLEIVLNGRRRELKVAATMKPMGYFALVVSGTVTDLGFENDDNVVLRLTISLADGRQECVETTLKGKDLTPCPKRFTICGTEQELLVIPAAPVRMDCNLKPLPVNLVGTVIKDHDPGKPVEAATVSHEALSTTTDAHGWFRLGPLPLKDRINLEIKKGLTSSQVTFYPDYGLRENCVMLSIENY